MTRATTMSTPDPLIDPILFARGMAVIRIFFGVILFANGLAKLEPSLARIDLGPYHANLVTSGGARGILNFEVNERRIREGAPWGTQVPGLQPFVNNVVLANWGSSSGSSSWLKWGSARCSWSGSPAAARRWSASASSCSWPWSMPRAIGGSLNSRTSMCPSSCWSWFPLAVCGAWMPGFCVVSLGFSTGRSDATCRSLPKAATPCYSWKEFPCRPLPISTVITSALPFRTNTPKSPRAPGRGFTESFAGVGNSFSWGDLTCDHANHAIAHSLSLLSAARIGQ